MTNTAKTPWLRPLLEKFSGFPGAFLVSQDVYALRAYIQGYSHAREDLGYPAFGEGEEELLGKFDRWLVEEKGGFPNMGWGFNIEKMDNSKDNVKTFFRLWKEFMSGVDV